MNKPTSLPDHVKERGLDPASLPDEVLGLLNDLHEHYLNYSEENKQLKQEMQLRTEALEQALKDSEEASQLKSLFVAKVSHEIRTPMNAILGMTQMVLGNELTPEIRECLGIVEQSTESLLNLITDILDFSKIEAGKLTISPRPFDIRACLKNCQALVETMLVKESIEIVSHVDKEIPTVLVGDKNRITQIIMNLLSNAAKFSRQGGIVMYVEFKNIQDSKVNFSVSVCDSGIGIPQSELGEIFEVFNSGDSRYDRVYGGTGLGLAITKNLLEAMGGNISVHSRVGVGSRFTLDFSLPIALQAEDYLNDEQKNTLRHDSSARLGVLEILVAEDNKVNQKVIQMLLERQGHSVTLVSDGTEAVCAFAKREFDIVLMDIQMPSLDGYEASKKIRLQEERSSKNKHVPIIAVTAHAFPEEHRKALAAGMNGFVTKPINRKKLFDQLTSALFKR